MKTLNLVAWLLVIVGALNWGLVGLFGFNFVDTVLGFMPVLVRLVYILVGVAGVYLIFLKVKTKD